ncbi:pseudaminic acid synthase [Ectothiorhodospira variabilis]|uniref:pseudaminic acid synthase n=1 Tax=Ectothiorhodospira variabilis TaxID=505694 RepID=UPI001EFC1333|nr:pseudaminic acid synthase [Ectothiorhodospira variabilis]MCG5496052.1 pseudaminic acid synthase [Ectothiorhodospira variabilis]MCG5499058.1 pseudaminic acid synthase [Ectothiorhodospira variabilis]MCG5505413.1 pseudaminic acid synthase [Ectothiorhodospira variabilis]MCG5508599.1 pseudaminic acid synthase [Ectothiorhodospira variabilis]
MIKIDGRIVLIGRAPYVIAEMSGNHNQSLDRALAIVDAAADAGAHAIKLQTYTPDTMTLDLDEGEFFISDPKSLWVGQSMHKLYEQAHTPWDWHAPIMERARERGIACFSSPFDESAVDFLESLDCSAYKIASFECIDLPLIRKAAATGKPLIISTGMATLPEIGEAVEAARGAGCQDLVLLKCTSTYPASPENTHLRTIAHMRELFGCEVGLSDHTMGIGASVAAVALGATVIEKHFTLSRAEGGVDAAFSLEPHELSALVTETERAWQALGEVRYGPTEAETKARLRRRSLYIAEDMKAGEVFTQKNLRRIRPGHGLPPKYYDVLLGKRVTRDVAKGTAVSWELVG